MLAANLSELAENFQKKIDQNPTLMTLKGPSEN
jgi:hypothetical protein